MARQGAPPVKIVCPSGSAENLYDMTSSIERTQPDFSGKNIIVVADRYDPTRIAWGWTILEGEEPFCCARNLNLGIKEALEQDPGADVLIVADDIKFQTQKPVDALRGHLEDCDVVSPLVKGAAAKIQQFSDGPFEDRLKKFKVKTNHDNPWFACVAISNYALRTVGPFREDLVHFEDTDWCFRGADLPERLGFSFGIATDVVVNHVTGKSLMRRDVAQWTKDHSASKKKLKQIWGDRVV